MRLKTKEYRELMKEKGLTPEQVCQSTGLSAYSLNWILDNGGFASDSTLQGLAVAAGVELGDIVRPEPSDNQENGIEFLRDGRTATVQFSQGRFKTRIKKLAQSHPEECQILAEDVDGVLLAHVPVSWVKISPPALKSEYQRKLSRERLLEFHKKRTSLAHEQGQKPILTPSAGKSLPKG